jgi:plastocyanin
MNKTIIIIALVAIVLLGGYFLFFKGKFRQAPSFPSPSFEQPTTSPPIIEEQPTEEESAGEEMVNVVSYTDSGYSPSTIKIKKGETVTFKNESSRSMWPASAVHPSHRVYSGTSLEEHCPDTSGTAFDACKGYLPGENWSFRFDKVGNWRYHDHLNPSATGTIIVEE